MFEGFFGTVHRHLNSRFALCALTDGKQTSGQLAKSVENVKRFGCRPHAGLGCSPAAWRGWDVLRRPGAMGLLPRRPHLQTGRLAHAQVSKWHLTTRGSSVG